MKLTFKKPWHANVTFETLWNETVTFDEKVWQNVHGDIVVHFYNVEVGLWTLEGLGSLGLGPQMVGLGPFIAVAMPFNVGLL